MPACAATHPHSRLPSVSPAENTMMYSDRARPRTHAGTETCAATCSDDRTMTHAAPAMTITPYKAASLRTVAKAAIVTA